MTFISINPTTIGLFQIVLVFFPQKILKKKTVHGQPLVHVTCRNIICLQATCASLNSDVRDPRCGRPCISLRSTEMSEYIPRQTTNAVLHILSSSLFTNHPSITPHVVRDTDSVVILSAQEYRGFYSSGCKITVWRGTKPHQSTEIKQSLRVTEGDIHTLGRTQMWLRPVR